jgi:ATP-dependent RNA helicase DDX27
MERDGFIVLDVNSTIVAEDSGDEKEIENVKERTKKVRIRKNNASSSSLSSSSRFAALEVEEVEEDSSVKKATSSEAGASNKPQSSWSFKDAIARIDATQSRAFRTTTLSQKIKNVQYAAERREQLEAEKREAAARIALGGKKSKKALKRSREEAKDKEDTEDDDEFDLEEGEEIEEVEVDDEEGENDDDDDDDDDENDDDEDDSDNDDEEEEEEEEADNFEEAPAEEDSLEFGNEETDRMLAGAKPNPHRQKASANAMENSALTAEYAAFFETDPFSKPPVTEFAEDKLRNLNEVDASSSSSAISKKAKQEKKNKKSKDGVASTLSSTESATNPLLALGGKEPMTFTEMNLSRPLLRSVQALGYTAPTPIQRRVVPLALAGQDVCGSAVTGSGKTAAYLLPVIERLLFATQGRRAISATRVLVLVPTRELATQVQSMCSQLSQFVQPAVRCALVVGGLSLKAQEAELRSRPDIVVATPGRMLDHIRNTLAVHVDEVDVLILDEADRLLELGFEDEVLEIVKSCPVGRQTMLFSATMTSKVETLAKLSLRKPVRVSADPLYDMANKLVQEFVRVRSGREKDREAILLSLCSRSFTGGGVLVFTDLKRTAHRIAILLGLAGMTCVELHGNLTQRQRLEALELFREGKADYLVATDLAGRGLDISGVRAVINMDMPRDMVTYVHRVGRTARAGRSGVAITLVSEGQRQLMKEVVKRAALNVRSRVVPQEVVANFSAKIAAWEDDVDRVLQAERVERELRIAEMEASKVENLLEHEQEILGRPARTWFMSKEEKDKVWEKKQELFKKASRESSSVGFTSPEDIAKAQEKERAEKLKEKSKDVAKQHDKGHRLTRKKRRRIEALQAVEADAKRVMKLETQLKDQRSEEKTSKAPLAVPISEKSLKKEKRRIQLTLQVNAGKSTLIKKGKVESRRNAQMNGLSAGQAAKFNEKKKKRGLVGSTKRSAFEDD